MPIGADGVYYFNTEMPGDESVVGWGQDPEAHIHYHLKCSGCAGSNPEFYNKFYPNKLCTLSACAKGSVKPGKQHQAEKSDKFGETYKYNIILQG